MEKNQVNNNNHDQYDDDHSSLVAHRFPAMYIDSSSSSAARFDSNDVVRVMLETLESFGLPQAKEALERESKVKLIPKTIMELKERINVGNWNDVVSMLSNQVETKHYDVDRSDGHEADESFFLMWSIYFVLQQEFLELIDAGENQSALLALRSIAQKLSKIKHKKSSKKGNGKSQSFEQIATKEIGNLATLFACKDKQRFCLTAQKLINKQHKIVFGGDNEAESSDPTAMEEDLSSSSNGKNEGKIIWKGKASRNELFDTLQRMVSPSLVVPRNRLYEIFKQASYYQILKANGILHDPASPEVIESIEHEVKKARHPLPLFDDITLSHWNGIVSDTFQEHDHRPHENGYSNGHSNGSHSLNGKESSKSSKLQVRNCHFYFGDHSDEIRRLEINESGKFLASGSKDRKIIIWRIIHNTSKEYQLQKAFAFENAHKSAIENLAWGRGESSSLLLSCGEDDCKIKIWRVKENDFSLFATLKHHILPVRALAWSHCGNYIISGGLDKIVIVWKTDGTIYQKWKEERVFDICPCIGINNTEFLFITCSDGSIRTHTLHENNSSFPSTDSLKHITGAILVQTSADSMKALVLTESQDILVLDTRSGDVVQTIVGGVQSPLYMIRPRFTQDGHHILCGSDKGTVKIWDAATGSLLDRLNNVHASTVNDICSYYNPKTRKTIFITASDDQSLGLWSME